MLSNHNSGPSMMPGLTGMEGSDVDGNDVTGINSNLYPPSSVSGDDTGKSMVWKDPYHCSMNGGQESIH